MKPLPLALAAVIALAVWPELFVVVIGGAISCVILACVLKGLLSS